MARGIILFMLPLLLACSSDEQERSGSFSILTYNVAGLPEGISSSHPEVNIPQISPQLNDFDLVLAQEDFWYHDELSSEASHPHQSEPWSDRPDMLDMGDGLNRFSIFPFGELTRTGWPDCNGATDCASDCLASKGFSVATHELDDGVLVDVYNLHMEAGGCPEDEVIRADSIQLLLDTFAERSAGVPIILAGDWNLHAADPIDMEQYERVLTEGGFVDACWSTDCTDEHIDRIFFRGTEDVTISAESWMVPAGYVDADGEDLSDHEPVAATLSWIAR